MTRTARQVIQEEAFQWMEKQDFVALNVTHMLEQQIGIWEYGKWCAKGSFSRLGIKAQIKFRGSRPESTAWDAVSDISDDEGMRIHAATVGLSPTELEIVDRIYVQWQPVAIALQRMKIGSDRFYKVRSAALNFIAERLENNLK